MDILDVLEEIRDVNAQHEHGTVSSTMACVTR